MGDNDSRQTCKQAIIKLSLAYNSQKMLFIGQNLKMVHSTHSFLERLIFFDQIDILYHMNNAFQISIFQIFVNVVSGFALYRYVKLIKIYNILSLVWKVYQKIL